DGGVARRDIVPAVVLGDHQPTSELVVHGEATGRCVAEILHKCLHGGRGSDHLAIADADQSGHANVHEGGLLHLQAKVEISDGPVAVFGPCPPEHFITAQGERGHIVHRDVHVGTQHVPDHVVASLGGLDRCVERIDMVAYPAIGGKHHHAVQQGPGAAVHPVIIVHLHAERTSRIAGDAHGGGRDLAGLEGRNDIGPNAAIAPVPCKAHAIVRRPCPAHVIGVHGGGIDHQFALQGIVCRDHIAADPRKRDLVPVCAGHGRHEGLGEQRFHSTVGLEAVHRNRFGHHRLPGCGQHTAHHGEGRQDLVPCILDPSGQGQRGPHRQGGAASAGLPYPIHCSILHLQQWNGGIVEAHGICCRWHQAL